MPLPLAGIAARIAARRATRKAAAARAAASGAKKGKKERDDRPGVLSPEGVAMLSVALILDLVPPVFVLALDIFFGVGEFISWPIDIFGTIVLGGWMWARGGKIASGKKMGQFLKRRGPFILAEYIPIVGALPFWTINVFLFLKK
jgi:hypothetical protein